MSAKREEVCRFARRRSGGKKERKDGQGKGIEGEGGGRKRKIGSAILNTKHRSLEVTQSVKR
jgi:hypothetical protein